jgi:hypothetical protein
LNVKPLEIKALDGSAEASITDHCPIEIKAFTDETSTDEISTDEAFTGQTFKPSSVEVLR